MLASDPDCVDVLFERVSLQIMTSLTVMSRRRRSRRRSKRRRRRRTATRVAVMYKKLDHPHLLETPIRN
jgi:hypothetical protein